MIKEFLEKNLADFEYSNFLIAKMQILLVAMLVVIFFQFAIESIWIMFAEGLFVGGYLFVLFKEIRKEFGEEFNAHLFFFLGILVFVQASWLLLVFFKELNQRINYFFYLLGGLIVFLFLFRLVFKKGFITGEVLLSDKELAVVKTKYDLIAFSKGGKFVVESGKRYKKGERVKIELKKGFWKRIPFKVVGKI